MHASRAEPEKITVSSSSDSRSMPLFTTCGAPSSAAGPFRDSITTWSMRPTAAALMPSSPMIAPDGISRRQPRSRARSSNSGCAMSAPTLMTIAPLPASNAAFTRPGATSPPAASTIRSACSISSPRLRYGTGESSVPRKSRAFDSLRLVTPATPMPSVPSSAARRIARPIAPHPTTPMLRALVLIRLALVAFFEPRDVIGHRLLRRVGVLEP